MNNKKKKRHERGKLERRNTHTAYDKSIRNALAFDKMALEILHFVHERKRERGRQRKGETGSARKKK